ncbi:efflux transporter outer membrane subunit [Roseibacillus ishigakijimensis]|uniref:Efflux transporter outer membrane subunit n=1 Tax=Roseibacillus ishigakijimensis TaxID=454146 RepID=A0A934VKR7_9BACT|nr:efflux transporter outer membrane subunit [Roseibacillus ishigakijimensis]MBK1833929.1 efflux transporter outer membrane subunit [Roseibacillus ishigakijimensis]
MKKVVIWSGLAGFLVLVAGCGVGSVPDSQMAAVTAMAPQSWVASGPGRAGVDEEWVRRFGDSRLEALVREAIAANPNLQSTREKVQRAVILAEASNAASLPQLNGTFNGNRNKQVFVGLPIPGSSGPLSSLSTNFGASLDVSWEPDIWGKVAAGQAADLARVGAEENAYRAARASLAGQVVKAWLALGEAQEQVALSQYTLGLRKKLETAVHERFANALSEDGGTAAQLRLARTEVANNEELIVSWQAEAERARRQLEILVGRYPAGQAGQGVTLPSLPTKPPVGLPSELLQRRPDVLEAERLFAAASKDREVAHWARFPSISLTSSAGRSSSQLEDLLKSDFGVWSLGGNLTAPILSGGQLRANYELSQSSERGALADLQSKVLAAFGEVEQALVADAFFDERLAAAERALAESEAADEAAVRDYADGLDNVLTVLEAQGQRTQIASQVVTLRRQRLENRVDLHLALGGDFKVRGK